MPTKTFDYEINEIQYLPQKKELEWFEFRGLTWEQVEEILQLDAYPPREALPVCISNRHERRRYAELFGNPEFYGLFQDPMLATDGTYHICFERVYFPGYKCEMYLWSLEKR